MAYVDGDRVGLILTEVEGVVKVVGFGEYKGKSIPDEEADGPMTRAFRAREVEVPEIELDDGRSVWASEVLWFGLEDKIRDQLDEFEEEGAEIEKVDIEDVREEWANRLEDEDLDYTMLELDGDNQ